MGGPEHSKSGSKTPQLDDEQREVDERGRVESCNSSPRHDGGEGVGGQNGNTDSGVGYGGGDGVEDGDKRRARQPRCYGGG